MNIPQISQMNPVGGSNLDRAPAPVGSQPSATFGEVMRGLVATANQQLNATDQAMADFDSGKTTDLNAVVMASVKADLSFRFLVEMRNRLTATYQELSRMQF